MRRCRLAPLALALALTAFAPTLPASLGVTPSAVSAVAVSIDGAPVQLPLPPRWCGMPAGPEARDSFAGRLLLLAQARPCDQDGTGHVLAWGLRLTATGTPLSLADGSSRRDHVEALGRALAAGDGGGVRPALVGAADDFVIWAMATSDEAGGSAEVAALETAIGRHAVAAMLVTPATQPVDGEALLRDLAARLMVLNDARLPPPTGGPSMGGVVVAVVASVLAGLGVFLLRERRRT